MKAPSKSGSNAAAWGYFSGLPRTTWLTGPGGDRLMQLDGAFTFHDTRANRVWTARDQMRFDGATIPRSLWTIAGSPFTGDYRCAAIVHDQACYDHPKEGAERRAADRMFMRACLAGGCSWMQAKLFYLAVRIGSLRTMFDKSVDIMAVDEVWLDGPPLEQARDRDIFVDIARDLRAADKAEVEIDPDRAADEIDAMLGARYSG